jgi:hypothetical protein
MFEQLKQQIQQDIENRNNKIKIDKCLCQKIEKAIMHQANLVKEQDK